MKRITHVTLSLALVLCYAGLSRAHNGKTAYAIPLSGITIDGKLDDWPQQMAIYPIDWISSFYKPTPPEGPDDLTASFHVGFDLEANLFYLAIVVQDEVLVIHPEAPSFTNQDLCEVYVDGNHSGGDVKGGSVNPRFQFTERELARGVGGAQQYVMVAGRGAYNRDVDGNPALLGEETEAVGVQAAVLRFDKTIVYEWAIPLFESFPDKRLQIRLGETVGFDVAVVDADDWAGGNWVSWTPESRKAFSSDLLGDLVFVQDYYGLEVVLTTVASVDYSDIGTIVGKVTRPDQSPRSGVRVRVEDQNGRIQGEGITGLDGGYRIWLHPGTYQVIVVDARGVEPVEVTLSASGEVEDVDFAPTAIGPTIPTWPFTTGLGVLGVAILACMVPLFQRRGRLGGVLLSPGDTFREVAAQPDWVGPFFLVLVSSLLISVTMTGKMLSAMGDFGGGMPGGMRIVMMTVMPLLMMAAALIFSYLAWLVRAGLIWAFARITGEQTPFYPLLSVVGYALVPQMLLGGIVMACAVGFGLVQVSTSDMWSLSMPTSLAGLFSGLAVGNDPIRALLREIELFSLWSLVLTIVGVQRVYGFPMGKAGIIVVLYWLLVVGTVVGFVALANAVQQMMTGG